MPVRYVVINDVRIIPGMRTNVPIVIRVDKLVPHMSNKRIKKKHQKQPGPPLAKELMREFKRSQQEIGK